MRLVLGTLLVAAAIGLISGGRWSRLAALRIRWAPAAIAGLALQYFAPPDGVLPIAMLLVSFALLIAFAVVNLPLPGFRLILLGVLLNFLVIAVNGGMPVSRSALEASGQLDTLNALVEDGGAKHHLAGEDDVLVFLGDVIPIRPIENVISVGDVLTYAGAAWFVVAGMRGRGRRPVVAPEPALGGQHAG